jgi:ATP-binding cassette, subfamily B, bacterial MsbA
MTTIKLPMKNLPITRDTYPLVARLWREWIKPHWPALSLVLLCVLLVAVASGFYPVLIKRAFEAFGAKDLDAIRLMSVMVIGVTTLRGFSLYAQGVLTNKVVTRIEADMQTALYAHLVHADLDQVQRQSPATFTQRFTTDFAFIKEALTRLSTVLLRDIATIIALVAAMIWIDAWLTFGALIVAPLVAIPIGRIGQKLRRVSTSTQEQIGAMADLVSESLQGARISRTFAMEPYLIERGAKAFEAVRRLKMKAANARARLDPLLEVAGGLAVALVLLLIGQRITQGETSLGDFTGFVTALLMAAQPIRSLGNLNAIVQEAAAALSRYYVIMDEKPQITDGAHAQHLTLTGGAITFDGVGFSYHALAPAVSDIHIEIPAGKMTALVGRSGSGKSTLLSLVPRLHDVENGAVRIDGQDVREVTLQSLRSAISVVSQDVMLFDDTIAANIAAGREDVTQAQIEAAAHAAAAHDFILKTPQGYATRVGHGGGKLSGGERQRLSLARAILKDAPILLLDEATSALDAESERFVQDALAQLMVGRTTLAIAHRLSTLRDADQIIVLEQGRVVETGTHTSLLALGGMYARLHAMQTQEMI